MEERCGSGDLHSSVVRTLETEGDREKGNGKGDAEKERPTCDINGFGFVSLKIR